MLENNLTKSVPASDNAAEPTHTTQSSSLHTKRDAEALFGKYLINLNSCLYAKFKVIETNITSTNKRVSALEIPQNTTKLFLKDTISFNTFISSNLAESNSIKYEANNIIIRGLPERVGQTSDLPMKVPG